MSRKRFTEEQIAFALRQHESGTAIAEIVRKMGISEQTFYRWKKKFAGSRHGTALAAFGASLSCVERH
jgi:putative transposase